MLVAGWVLCQAPWVGAQQATAPPANAAPTAPSAATEPAAQEPAAPAAGESAEQEPSSDEPSSEGSLPSGLQPPQLLEFVDAQYPAEAAAEGREAEVILVLRVEADGHVSEATVQEPAGRGFDQAAEAAALQFRFEPARLRGEPVAVRIPFRYVFELKPATADSEPEPITGQLGVRLEVAGTSEPLAGATVRVTAPDGQALQFLTNAAGSWNSGDLPPGQYEISIAAPGFDEIVATESVAAGELTEIVYQVFPSVADSIVVSVVGTRPPREVTRRTISRREMTRIPGTSGDALRSIQSLPGVARPPGLAGLLIIRGAAPQDSLIFIDGDQVPLIYHFGGLSSAVPSELLDSIDFYPGNFSGRYGRAMGGIVDVKLRAPDAQCRDSKGTPTGDDTCFHGMAQVDLLDARLLLQGPLPMDGWTFAVAGRRSWVDAWLGPVLREAGTSVTTAPVYADYQLIAERAVSEDDRLSFRFFGSSDRLELLVENPGAQDPGVAGGSVSFATGFWRLQSSIASQLSPSFGLRALVSVGKDAIDFNIGRFRFRIDSYPIQTRSELSFRPFGGLTFHAGLDFQIIPNDLLIRLPEPPRPGTASPGPFTTRPVLEQSGSDTFFRPAWYGDVQIKPTPRLSVTGGLRVDFARDSGQADASPRMTFRYDVTTSSNAEDGTLQRRTTLKGGAGLFHQPPQPQETDEVFGTPGLETNRAEHYSLGVERELTDQIEVGVEGFYKRLDNLVSRAPGPAGAFDYQNAGTGDVLGAETLIKYKPDDHFFGWLAYTLSRSRRRDSPDEPTRPFQFDQTHILTVLGSYRLGRGWEVGARFRLVSGALDTPVQRPPNLQALYAADAAAYTPLEGAPFSQRLPTFHQLDFRVEKNWQLGAYRLMFYLDVLNSYNHAASESFLYNFDFSTQSYQQGLPLLPSLGLRGEF